MLPLRNHDPEDVHLQLYDLKGAHINSVVFQLESTFSDKSVPFPCHIPGQMLILQSSIFENIAFLFQAH